MAFSFNNSSGGAAGMPSINVGTDLTIFESEHLGFSNYSKGKSVQLLPTPWPKDALPPQTSNLLSIANKRGILAAGGPDALIIASTDSIRQQLFNPDNTQDVIQFEPDGTIPAPRIRHVAFSASSEDFLVVAAEEGGGLAVYGVEDLLKGNTEPGTQIGTEQIGVRALAPNPNPDFEHLFAVILDSGALAFADISQGQLRSIHADGVTCVSWSARGKAIVAGLENGTAIQYSVEGKHMANIPRPPEVPEGFSTSGITWLANDEFFIIYAPKSASGADEDSMGGDEDPLFYCVNTDKKRTSFSFAKTTDPILFKSLDETRNGPTRFSVLRLREWQPGLEGILLFSASNSPDISVLTKSTIPISEQQQVVNEWAVTTQYDHSRAQIPPDADGCDSVLIGEVLDLSSKDTIMRPIPTEEDYKETPGPLPMLLALTSDGVLAVWWIVYNKAIREGKEYLGMVHGTKAASADQEAPQSPEPVPASQTPQTSSMFGAPASSATPATFSAPQFGAAGFGQPSLFGKPSAFGSPSQSAFGAPSSMGINKSLFGAPASTTDKPSVFGAPSGMGSTGASAFGAPSSIGSKPSPFGAPSSMGNKPSPFGAPAGTTDKPSVFGAPSFGAPSAVGGAVKPAFGAPSAIGGAVKPAFGAPSAIGGAMKPAFGQPAAIARPSPWSAASQTSPTASSTDTSKANPFAKFGDGNGSAFSSFGSTTGPASPSPFGQQKPSSGNGFAPIKGLSKTEPSFGSTVTVGSSLGGGSTLPSWANTPAQQGSSIFGAGTSSFASTKDSGASDAGDTINRDRDEATPTPQAPPKQTPGLFGLAGNGFKIGSSFKGDGTANDDLPVPKGSEQPSLFGGDFAAALGGGSTKPPATPMKKEETEPRLQDISTTPASPPKRPGTLFPSTTPGPSQTPAGKPPTEEESPVPEDAPLPPDFTTWKAPKNTDDELPPLAGSPAIKVEAPESSIPSSPLNEDEEEGDDLSGEISVEEQEEDEEEEEESEEEEPSPSDTARRPRPQQAMWSFADSTNQSPQIRPAAPTPPAVKSGTSSRSPSRPPTLFGQPAKPSASSLFQQSATTTGFPQPPTIFQPQPTRMQDSLRSPSPVRASSTSSGGTKRSSMFPQGGSLSASIQQHSKPPTPQPEVSDLEDLADEQIRKELASEVIPSRTLDGFIAHQDYTGLVRKGGIPAQIELLYRDINSMVDTLGLNARNLSAFMKYHLQRGRPQSVIHNDIKEVADEDESDAWFEKWSLSEFREVIEFQTQIEQVLNAGRVQDIHGKANLLGRLLQDGAKLETKLNEIRRQLVGRKDPEKLAVLRKASLPKELADQQKALRTEYAHTLSLLSQAEEETILLRSKLAAQDMEKGRPGAVPTVDAVKKTINKLIAMTEKKNNEILLLESQMRKLGVEDGSRPSPSSSRQLGTPSRSRALKPQSPFTTPSKMSISELNRRVQTPEVENGTPNTGIGYSTPLESPTQENSLANLVDDLDGEQLDQVMETARKRRAVAKNLADTVLAKGVRVTRVA
ncbi:hypothetical protein P154DRAFT_522002 [Amniculicola lignicola CBS 123094]|uniref:Nucleoporin Nup159/Nup146 N-terminal domain-containing protein n=1 Tax=Amniculicola lignicola CBS 123094 TaxID=1392246 RepID=A0A6A5WGR7_9PLEO|nr:hypothetical protein P154DRAFT_522002 [Amniculicola lignicola CBS 123094]